MFSCYSSVETRESPPSPFGAPAPTKFNPQQATFKYRQNLEQPLRGSGVGDGYVSLLDAASKSTPDASGQIKIYITGNSLF